MQQPRQLLMFAPTVISTGRADGGVLVIPGKPVLEEEYLSVKQLAKLSGYTRQQVVNIVKGSDIWQRGPKCKIRVPMAVAKRLGLVRE